VPVRRPHRAPGNRQRGHRSTLYVQVLSLHFDVTVCRRWGGSIAFGVRIGSTCVVARLNGRRTLRGSVSALETDPRVFVGQLLGTDPLRCIPCVGASLSNVRLPPPPPPPYRPSVHHAACCNTHVTQTRQSTTYVRTPYVCLEPYVRACILRHNWCISVPALRLGIAKNLCVPGWQTMHSFTLLTGRFSLLPLCSMQALMAFLMQ